MRIKIGYKFSCRTPLKINAKSMMLREIKSKPGSKKIDRVFFLFLLFRFFGEIPIGKKTHEWHGQIGVPAYGILFNMD